MIHEILGIISLVFIMITCTSCSNEANSNELINSRTSVEKSIQRKDAEDAEKTENIEDQVNSTSTQELQVPRTKEELEEALGSVNEQGNWTPPEGSYIDSKTGNIINKDGVVVGTTQEPYTKARPGSQG